MFPPDGAGSTGDLHIVRKLAAEAVPKTIGTTGAAAATQTSYGVPFTVASDIRFPLEGMRNTGFYDEIPKKTSKNSKTSVATSGKICKTFGKH